MDQIVAPLYLDTLESSTFSISNREISRNMIISSDANQFTFESSSLSPVLADEGREGLPGSLLFGSQSSFVRVNGTRNR